MGEVNTGIRFQDNNLRHQEVVITDSSGKMRAMTAETAEATRANSVAERARDTAAIEAKANRIGEALSALRDTLKGMEGKNEEFLAAVINGATVWAESFKDHYTEDDIEENAKSYIRDLTREEDGFNLSDGELSGLASAYVDFLQKMYPDALVY